MDKKEAETVKNAFIELGFSKNTEKRARQHEEEEDAFDLSTQLPTLKKKVEHVATNSQRRLALVKRTVKENFKDHSTSQPPITLRHSEATPVLLWIPS